MFAQFAYNDAPALQAMTDAEASTAPDALARQLERSSLTPQFGTTINGRRVFLVSKTAPLNSDKNILTVLPGALKSFISEFSGKLNELFHKLYQRSATSGKVNGYHTAWELELETLDGRMQTVWDTVIGLYSQIPTLAHPRAQIEALKGIMHLEQLAFQLKEQCRALRLLLASPHHQKALECYKEMVKGCDDLVKKPIEEKVSGLSGLFVTASLKIHAATSQLADEPPLVKEESERLYDDTLKYILHTASCFIKEIPASNEKLKKDLEDLVGYVTQKLGNTATPAPVVDAQQPPTSVPVSVYVQQAGTIELPVANLFRNGQYKYWADWSGFSYPEILKQVNQLTSIAKALYKVQGELQETIRSTCQRDVDSLVLEAALNTHTATIQDLERLIGAEAQALQALPLSNQIHAGLYYVAGLLTQGKTISCTAEQFLQMAKGSFGLHAKALHQLIKYVESKDALAENSTVTSICNLYAAVQAACAIKEPLNNNTRVYTVIEQILAIAGSTLLKLSAEESQIPHKLLTRKMLPGTLRLGDASGTLQTYLMKGFLQHLHFSKTDHGTSDPELEMALFILKSDPVYKTGFNELLSTNKELQALYSAYIKQSDMEAHAQTLETMSTLVEMLERTSPEGAADEVRKADVFVRYHKANQAMLAFKAKCQDQGPAQCARAKWLEDKVATFAATWAEDLDVEEDLKRYEGKVSEFLHSHLCKSLCAVEPASRLAADREILATVLKGNDTLSGIVKVLMNRWTLERFVEYAKQGTAARAVSFFKSELFGYSVEEKTITEAEVEILTTLFTEYLTDPTQTALWRCQYDTGYMEMALKEFYLKTIEWESQFSKEDILLETRGYAEINTWQQVLYHYAAFRRLVDSNGCLIPNSDPYREALSCYEQAKECLEPAQLKLDKGVNNNAIGHRTTSKLLLDEMDEFLEQRRFTYSQT